MSNDISNAKNAQPQRSNSSVLARRIVTLCLSLVLSISAIFTAVNLVTLLGITRRNLQDTVDLTVNYLNMDVRNALLPALDLTNTITLMIPNINSYTEMEDIFAGVLDSVPSVFEIYYGTAVSRFDGGVFVTATDWEPYLTNPEWDQTKRPWFITGMQNPGRLVITDPYEDSSTGEMCVSIVKTVELGGRIIGVVGTDVFLDVITEMVTSRKITSDGNTFVIGKDGTYLIHRNSELVNEANFFETEGRSIRSGIENTKGIFFNIEGNVYWAAVPVTDMDWYIVTTGTTNEFMAVFWQALVITVALAILLSFVAVVISLLFSRILTRPIVRLFGVLKGLAAGDLTQTVEVKGNDEISQMSSMLRETQSGIRAILTDIDSRARKLEKTGEELSKIMNESAITLHQIRTNMQNMSEKSVNQSASVTETNTTMSQIVKNIEILDQNIETQAERVSRSSSEIEKMIRHTTAATQSLVKNEKNVENLAVASAEGYTAVQKVSEDINTVTSESEKLLEINQVIQKIASQTNLLAMNAAIEAAHAGEVGRGFAVVADEIRKLAESSSGQAKTVSDVLKKIKNALDSISSASGAVLSGFAVIDEAVKTVAGHENSIRDTMETQDSGSKELLQDMAGSLDITRKVRSSSGEMLIGSREVIGEGQRLEVLTAEMTRGIEEIAESLKLLNTTVTHADGMSRENNESINVLLEEISRFKIN